MSSYPTRLRAFAAAAATAAVLVAVPVGPTQAAAPASSASQTPTPTASAGSDLAVTAGSSPAAVTPSVTTATPLSVVTTAPIRVDRPRTVAAATVIVALARTHLGARYRWGSAGPGTFDCSGLVWRVFQQARLGRDVTSRSAIWIYRQYLRRGLASRSHPQVGDLVVWGYGSHIGIYIGHGLAISALIEGVRVHRVNAVLTPFTTYLHTGLSRLTLPIGLLPRGV